MTEPVQTTAEAPAAPTPAEAPAPEPTLEELAAKLFKPEGDAPAASAEETPVEPPAEEAAPEEPKQDRVGARIAAAKRAEQKAAMERRELTQLREQQERRQAELDAREKRIKLIEEDPVRFFEEFKADPKTFLEKLSGEYKPENVATKKLTALEEELKQLREERDRSAAAAKEQAAKVQAESAWKEASSAFIAHVGEKADKYKHLVEELTESEATNLAYTVLTEVVGYDEGKRPVTRAEAYHREFGAYPDNDVIAEYLDAIAKQRVEARTKSAWRKRGESATPASEASPNGDPKPVPPVTGTKPRTLTSREASQRTAAPKPMTQEEIDAECIRIIEQGFRKTG